MDLKRRSRARIKYSANVLVRSKERGSAQGLVVDISINSIYVRCSPIFGEDEKVDVEIVLTGNESELIIKAVGEVVRIDPDGVAVTFSSPLEWWPVFSLFPFHQLDIE